MVRLVGRGPGGLFLSQKGLMMLAVAEPASLVDSHS